MKRLREEETDESHIIDNIHKKSKDLQMSPVSDDIACLYCLPSDTLGHIMSFLELADWRALCRALVGACVYSVTDTGQYERLREAYQTLKTGHQLPRRQRQCIVALSRLCRVTFESQSAVPCIVVAPHNVVTHEDAGDDEWFFRFLYAESCVYCGENQLAACAITLDGNFADAEASREIGCEQQRLYLCAACNEAIHVNQVTRRTIGVVGARTAGPSMLSLWQTIAYHILGAVKRVKTRSGTIDAHCLRQIIRLFPWCDGVFPLNHKGRQLVHRQIRRVAHASPQTITTTTVGEADGTQEQQTMYLLSDVKRVFKIV